MPLRITPQTIIPVATDPTITTTSYANGFQNIPPLANVGNVYVTNTTQTTVNIINKIGVAGSNSQIQFNLNGKLKGDAYLTYNNSTKVLNVGGVALVGAVRTDVLQYANGVPWPTDYGNAQVANYLPINSSNVSGNNFIGNGWRLSYLNPANIDGQVANALLSGTVYSNAQPNITSVGSLSSLNVSGNATITGNLTVTGNTYYVDVTTLNVKDPIIEMGGNPNGDPLTTNDGKDRGSLLHYYTTEPIDAFMGWDNSNAEFALGSNVSVTNDVVTFNAYGNVRADRFIGNGALLSSINGSNVTSGQVPNALVAGTVYTNAQPNITSTGQLSDLSVNGNTIITTNGYLNVQNTAPSTNQTSGAIITAGGIGAIGNVHAEHIHANSSMYAKNTVYAGNNSIGTTLTAPVFIGKDTGIEFVQAAVINSSNTGSSDWAAYGDSADESGGWTDLGFTGTAFSDANYSITKPSDGYVFVQGMSGQGGNLVLATGDQGNSVSRDIIFAVGGFASVNEFGRISYANLALEIISNTESNSKTTGSITTLGGIGANGNIYANAFYGDGTNVTNVSVSGAQTGITGVGTLSGLSIGGQVTAAGDDNYDIGNATNRFRNLSLSGNANIGGNITANFFIGDGGFLSNVNTGNPFDQNLNTTDTVAFSSVVTPGIILSPSLSTITDSGGLNITSSPSKTPIYIYNYGSDGYGANASEIDVLENRVDIYAQYGTVNQSKWSFRNVTNGELLEGPNIFIGSVSGDDQISSANGLHNTYVGGKDLKSYVKFYGPDNTNVDVSSIPYANRIEINSSPDTGNGRITLQAGPPSSPFYGEIVIGNNANPAHEFPPTGPIVATLTNTIEIAGGIASYGDVMIGAGSNLGVRGNIVFNDGSLQDTAWVSEAPFTIETSNFSVVAGKRYGVDTTSNTVTATLPASPVTGSAILFADAGGAYSTNNLTIDAGLNTIMGSGSTLTISTNNQSVGLFYNGTTWRIYNAG